MTKDDKLKAAAEAKVKIDKDMGKGTVMSLSQKPDMDIEVISTGSLGLDIALGVGGLPKGRIVEIYGPESCLTGDTYIKYKLCNKNGKNRNSKGGTLKTLYEKFNNLPVTTKYKKNSAAVEGDYYTVQSVNEENRIVHSKINQVVHNGKKEVYELTLANGFKIKATEDHKFFNGHKYIPLEQLMIGETIHIHNNTPYRVDKYEYKYYKEVYVKYHPHWRFRVVNNCLYYRATVSRAVYEANLNKLEYSEYITLLNTGDKTKIESLKFITDKDSHIHHINEDNTDNRIENLMLISSSEHGKLHSEERHNNLRFISVPHPVVSIRPVGIEDVYDIQCEDPYHNYIANGFVVHNCGKTTLAIHVMAEAQKLGGLCAIIDAEHAFDKEYAQALGVNVGELDISQPDYGEQALEIADRLICSKAYDVIVIDSVAALVPLSEIEGEIGDNKMGAQARLMSQALRKIPGHAKKANTLVIFINQLREKIGVMFGSPETTPGGNSLKFYASVRLDVRRSTTTANSVIEDDISIGNLTKVKVIKNKVAPPFRSCEFDILYGVGVDKIGELVKVATELDIIKKGGSWFTYGEDVRIQGLTTFKQFLSDNPELYEEIKQLVKDKTL